MQKKLFDGRAPPGRVWEERRKVTGGEENGKGTDEIGRGREVFSMARILFLRR